MRIAAKVFIIIAIVQTIIGLMYGIIMSILDNIPWLGILLFILSVFILIISFIGLHSIYNYTKRTSIGVLLLLFVSLFGGIFYLCWNEYKPKYSSVYQHSVSSLSSNSAFKTSTYLTNDRVLVNTWKNGKQVSYYGTIIEYDSNSRTYKVKADNGITQFISSNSLQKLAKKTEPSSTEKLRELKKLYDDGILSESEYNEKRQKYLADL